MSIVAAGSGPCDPSSPLHHILDVPWRLRTPGAPASRRRDVLRIIPSQTYDVLLRARVERFIETAYRRQFDSAITAHYPTLISLHASDETICAALGVIAGAVRKYLGIFTFGEQKANGDDKDVIRSNVARVDVRPDHLAVQLSVTPERDGQSNMSSDCDDPIQQRKSRKRKRQDGDKAATLTIAWTKTPSRKPRQLIPPTSTTSRSDPRPIRAETRTKLIAAIAKGRQWLDELVAGTVTNAEQIAARETCTVRQVNMTV